MTTRKRINIGNVDHLQCTTCKAWKMCVSFFRLNRAPWLSSACKDCHATQNRTSAALVKRRIREKQKLIASRSALLNASSHADRVAAKVIEVEAAQAIEAMPAYYPRRGVYCELTGRRWRSVTVLALDIGKSEKFIRDHIREGRAIDGLRYTYEGKVA